MNKPKLTLFDLDHTLLSGDSDVLWCDFLMDQGVLDRATFAALNADMETRYKAGTVGVQEFADFYIGTLAGKTQQQWEDLRREFLVTQVIPRIPQAAVDVSCSEVERQEAGHSPTLTSRPPMVRPKPPAA